MEADSSFAAASFSSPRKRSKGPTSDESVSRCSGERASGKG